MLSSTMDKDTVIKPLKMYWSVGTRGCLFRTGDHIPGNLEDDHRWLIETHFEREHDAPSLAMVEGAMDKVRWEAFIWWYVHYRARSSIRRCRTTGTGYSPSWRQT